MKKILYVEDDETLAFLTSDNLSDYGFGVKHVNNGLDALATFKSENFDICILDIMIPKMDGFALAKEIRKINHEIPIIFLSAKSMSEDRLEGLKLGADDYLVKPFSMEELVLKIKIFLSRSKKNNKLEPENYSIGKFTFSPKKQKLEISSRTINLTHKEAQVLELLAKSKGEIVKKDSILFSIWGDNDYFMGRSLDVFISRLRKILSEDPNIKIENYHGVGFSLEVLS